MQVAYRFAAWIRRLLYAIAVLKRMNILLTYVTSANTILQISE